jgi:hypothetical protein
MKNIKDVFYGDALIEAYRAEKAIQAMGLFMSNRVVAYSDIFETKRFNPNCHFAYIMQSLQGVSFKRADYPIDPVLLLDNDQIWFVAYDIRYLQVIHGHKNDSALSPRVRKKYETTWRFLQKQLGGFMSALEDSASIPKQSVVAIGPNHSGGSEPRTGFSAKRQSSLHEKSERDEWQTIHFST